MSKMARHTWPLYTRAPSDAGSRSRSRPLGALEIIVAGPFELATGLKFVSLLVRVLLLVLLLLLIILDCSLAATWPLAPVSSAASRPVSAVALKARQPGDMQPAAAMINGVAQAAARRDNGGLVGAKRAAAKFEDLGPNERLLVVLLRRRRRQRSRQLEAQSGSVGRLAGRNSGLANGITSAKSKRSADQNSDFNGKLAARAMLQHQTAPLGDAERARNSIYVASSSIQEGERKLMEWQQRSQRNRAISGQTYNVLLAFYALFIVLGTISNSLICLTVVLKPRVLSPRNLFIVNLACSDLLLCVFTMPFTFIQITTHYWRLGVITCKLVRSLQATSIFVSTISITAIAVDRYKVIVYPKHQEAAARVTGGALALVAGVWAGALLLALPLFHFTALKALAAQVKLPPGTEMKAADMMYCSEEWPDSSIDNGHGVYSALYSIFSMILQYVVPITIVSIIYAKISNKLQKRLIRRQRSTQLISQQRRQLNLIKRTHAMLISVSLVFGLCWLPLNLVNLIDKISQIFTDENTFRLTFAICHLIGCSSACSNPILYGYMNENFRRELVQVYAHHLRRCQRLVCHLVPSCCGQILSSLFQRHAKQTSSEANDSGCPKAPTSSAASSPSYSSSSQTSGTCNAGEISKRAKQHDNGRLDEANRDQDELQASRICQDDDRHDDEAASESARFGPIPSSLACQRPFRPDLNRMRHSKASGNGSLHHSSWPESLARVTTGLVLSSSDQVAATRTSADQQGCILALDGNHDFVGFRATPRNVASVTTSNNNNDNKTNDIANAKAGSDATATASAGHAALSSMARQLRKCVCLFNLSGSPTDRLSQPTQSATSEQASAKTSALELLEAPRAVPPSGARARRLAPIAAKPAALAPRRDRERCQCRCHCHQRLKLGLSLRPTCLARPKLLANGAPKAASCASSLDGQVSLGIERQPAATVSVLQEQNTSRRVSKQQSLLVNGRRSTDLCLLEKQSQGQATPLQLGEQVRHPASGLEQVGQRVWLRCFPSSCKRIPTGDYAKAFELPAKNRATDLVKRLAKPIGAIINHRPQVGSAVAASLPQPAKYRRIARRRSHCEICLPSVQRRSQARRELRRQQASAISQRQQSSQRVPIKLIGSKAMPSSPSSAKLSEPTDANPSNASRGRGSHSKQQRPADANLSPDMPNCYLTVELPGGWKGSGSLSKEPSTSIIVLNGQDELEHQEHLATGCSRRTASIPATIEQRLIEQASLGGRKLQPQKLRPQWVKLDDGCGYTDNHHQDDHPDKSLLNGDQGSLLGANEAETARSSKQLGPSSKVYEQKLAGCPIGAEGQVQQVKSTGLPSPFASSASSSSSPFQFSTSSAAMLSPAAPTGPDSGQASSACASFAASGHDMAGAGHVGGPSGAASSSGKSAGLRSAVSTCNSICLSTMSLPPALSCQTVCQHQFQSFYSLCPAVLPSASSTCTWSIDCSCLLSGRLKNPQARGQERLAGTDSSHATSLDSGRFAPNGPLASFKTTPVGHQTGQMPAPSSQDSMNIQSWPTSFTNQSLTSSKQNKRQADSQAPVAGHRQSAQTQSTRVGN